MDRRNGGGMSEYGPLREEFIVCYAPGYPDPFRVHPPTLEKARKFAAEHTRPGWRLPEIKRRVVSEWEDVE